VRTVNHSQVYERFGGHSNTLLINVLPPHDYAMAHIPGSINIPVDDPNFVTRVSEEMLDPDQEVIVYCRSRESNAAEIAAKKLQQAGLHHIYTFVGGLEEWRTGGHEIEMFAMDTDETDRLRAQARTEISQPQRIATLLDTMPFHTNGNPDFLSADKIQAGKDRLRPH
jgi:rhodanese-related sulfurtransferase